MYWNILSVPMWLHLVDSDLDNIVLRSVLIKVEDPTDHKKMKKIIKALEKAIDDSSVTITNQQDTKDASQSALDLLDLVFYIIIGIMMFLCFFSLQANMVANMYEQTKEIGVLRSIGFTSYRICMLYFYEALLLVFASCLLGIMIGVAVGFTMVL